MNYTWLVEKYLEGELEGEALKKFELEILRKPEVAAEVERIRMLNRFLAEQHRKMKDSSVLIEDFEDSGNVISANEIQRDLEGLQNSGTGDANSDVEDFRTRVEEIQLEARPNMIQRRKILFRRISVWTAASVLVVMTSIFTLSRFGIGETDYANLYLQYYSHRPADVERNVSPGQSDPFIQALQAYNRQDYREALRLFNIIAEDSVNNRYYLYKGLAAMELGDYPLALQQFGILDRDVSLRHEGMWYSCLCYLAMKDEKKLRSALKAIVESDGFYKDRAASLLRKI